MPGNKYRRHDHNSLAPDPQVCTHSLQKQGPVAYDKACVRGEGLEYGGGAAVALRSGQVLVQVGVAGVALEVLARDEVLDALLDLHGGRPG